MISLPPTARSAIAMTSCGLSRVVRRLTLKGKRAPSLDCREPGLRAHRAGGRTLEQVVESAKRRFCVGMDGEVERNPAVRQLVAVEIDARDLRPRCRAVGEAAGLSDMQRRADREEQIGIV